MDIHLYILSMFLVYTLAEPPNRDYNQLLNHVNELSEKFKDLETSNSVLQTKVKTLEGALKHQGDQHAHSERMYEEKIEELNNKLKSHQTWQTGMDLSTHELSQAVKHLEERCSLEDLSESSETLRTNRQAETDNPIAFYAGMTHSNTLGYHDNIVFDHVTLNLGNHYIPSHGIFVVPVPGIYVFSTTLMIDLSTDTHAAIYINNTLATWIKLYGSEHEFDTMSQTAIYQLEQGDAVAIRHTETNKTFHGQYTYFSGFLLKQTYDSGVIVG